MVENETKGLNLIRQLEVHVTTFSICHGTGPGMLLLPLLVIKAGLWAALDPDCTFNDFSRRRSRPKGPKNHAQDEQEQQHEQLRGRVILQVQE
jgi:hypothetical protein